jgi:hypothetical protein
MVVPWQLSSNYIRFRDAKIFNKLLFLQKKQFFVKEIKDLFDMIKNILFSEMEYWNLILQTCAENRPCTNYLMCFDHKFQY